MADCGDGRESTTSIMPTIPRGHTHAAAMMIGKRRQACCARGSRSGEARGELVTEDAYDSGDRGRTGLPIGEDEGPRAAESRLPDGDGAQGAGGDLAPGGPARHDRDAD